MQQTEGKSIIRPWRPTHRENFGWNVVMRMVCVSLCWRHCPQSAKLLSFVHLACLLVCGKHLSLSFLCVTWNLPIAGGVVLTNRDKTSKNRQGEYWIWSPSASCLWNSCTEQEQEQKVLMEWADFVLILSSQLQIIIGFLQRLIVMHFCNRSTNWVLGAKHLHVAIVNFFLPQNIFAVLICLFSDGHISVTSLWTTLYAVCLQMQMTKINMLVTANLHSAYIYATPHLVFLYFFNLHSTLSFSRCDTQFPNSAPGRMKRDTERLGCIGIGSYRSRRDCRHLLGPSLLPSGSCFDSLL